MTIIELEEKLKALEKDIENIRSIERLLVNSRDKARRELNERKGLPVTGRKTQ